MNTAFHLFLICVSIVLLSVEAEAFNPNRQAELRSWSLHHRSDRRTLFSRSVSITAPAQPRQSGTASCLSAIPLAKSIPSATASVVKLATSLRGGAVVGELSDLVEGAYDWCTNLGAPAALIAGAVIATLYDVMKDDDLDIKPGDSAWIRFCKRLSLLLLISAFALEVLSIFVTTVTGTMLYSRPLELMATKVPVTATTTPLSFLRDNFEFEYLTARISFLQGLLNWLGAIALAYFVRERKENLSTQRMNRFLGTTMFSTILLMVSFYNNHMTFYPNYWYMLGHWFAISWKRFIWCWPPRPMAFLFVPMAVLSAYLGIKAFADSEVEAEEIATADKSPDVAQPPTPPPPPTESML